MPSTLASETRDAVDDRPFLRLALRAGVVNYAAAARFLDVSEDTEAVATALRRYAEDLPDYETADRSARVTMQSGVGPVEGDEKGDEGAAEGVLAVTDRTYAPGEGSLTAVVAAGEVDTRTLAVVLDRLHASEIRVDAAGVADDGLVVLVERRGGPDAIRVVEDALDAVPQV